MAATDQGTSRRPLLRVLIAIGVILFPLGYSVLSSVFAASNGNQPEVFLEMPVEGSGPCVMDPTWMRYRHMDLLKELRIDAVRHGIREWDGKQINFNTCTTCHLNRSTFCDRCHEAVNLYPDCFGCHWYPE